MRLFSLSMKRPFIYYVFASLAILFVGISFYRGGIFELAGLTAKGFGVAPSLINRNDLAPGQRLDEGVYLLRGDDEDEEDVRIKIEDSEIKPWISADQVPRFKKGEFRAYAPLSILIPTGTASGTYSGHIVFSTAPPLLKSGVGISLGARIKVTLKIKNDGTNEHIMHLPAVESELTVKDNRRLHERLKGYIIIKVQDGGKAYYFPPEGDSALYLGGPEKALTMLKEVAIPVDASILDLMGLENVSGDKIKENRYARYAGKILIDKTKGDVWYLNPLSLKRYYLNTPQDALKTIKANGLGVSNRDFNSLFKD